MLSSVLEKMGSHCGFPSVYCGPIHEILILSCYCINISRLRISVTLVRRSQWGYSEELRVMVRLKSVTVQETIIVLMSYLVYLSQLSSKLQLTNLVKVCCYKCLSYVGLIPNIVKSKGSSPLLNFFTLLLPNTVCLLIRRFGKE